MKNDSGMGCGTMLTLLVLAVIGVVAAGFLVKEFGKGYAQGGGEMDLRLFSDEISASADEGIAIAGDNNEIGDIDNAVNEPISGEDGEWAALLPLCIVGIGIALILGLYAYLSSGSDLDSF